MHGQMSRKPNNQTHTLERRTNVSIRGLGRQPLDKDIRACDVQCVSVALLRIALRGTARLPTIRATDRQCNIQLALQSGHCFQLTAFKLAASLRPVGSRDNTRATARGLVSNNACTALYEPCTHARDKRSGFLHKGRKTHNTIIKISENQRKSGNCFITKSHSKNSSAIIQTSVVGVDS